LCRRSDTKLYELCSSILNNQTHNINIDDLTNKPFQSYKNICYTNGKRKQINDECMHRFLNSCKPRETHKVTKLTYDNNTQDYTVCKGMPLISRLNMKSLDIVNNEIFTCNKIDTDTIEVTNEFKTIQIPKEKFTKLFLLTFCITTHKSQGLSLNEKYCIHEYEKFDKKLKYVALSRATKYENINIVMKKDTLNALSYCGYIPCYVK
jgi:hypothetical protein